MQEEHLILTPLVFATHLVRALEIFAQQRNAVEAAIAREQAARLRDLRQWERLSQAVLGITADALISDAYMGTPRTSAQDDSLGSGVGFSAGDEAGLPVFRTPPGLQPSTGYHRIPEHVWEGLTQEERKKEYYKGRARRQRLRRLMLKNESRCAEAGQDAPYQ